MEQPPSIVRHHDLNVIIKRQADNDLLDYLKTTVLGTPGGIRYKHTQTADKIHVLGETYFLLLQKSGRMLGSVGLCYRETLFSGQRYSSWYGRYFAIRGALRTAKPRSEKLMEQSGKGISLLRNAVSPYLAGPGENLRSQPAGTEKSLVYGYIEAGNFQSMQFAVQNEFETVRNFTTYMFSRFFPRENKNVSRIQKEEKDQVRKRLEEFYSDHTLYMDVNLFYREDYLVYKKDGRIVAGMQANPDGWEIKEMGGQMGKFIMAVFPFVPWINRIFNPRKLKFVAGDYIFWEEGFEYAMNELFETACKINHTGILITWSDTGSKLIKILDKHTNQGFISKIIKRVDADIKIKFNGFGRQEKEIFYKNPSFISSFDTT